MLHVWSKKATISQEVVYVHGCSEGRSHRSIETNLHHRGAGCFIVDIGDFGATQRTCYSRSVSVSTYDFRNMGSDNHVYVLSGERDKSRDFV